MGKVAIHGFGRIGRSALKAALNGNLFTPVSISDIRDIPTFAALRALTSAGATFYTSIRARNCRIGARWVWMS
jgi:glyceraldehyde 3-phosphate dehydrogenase